jgi:hypothetical protein
VRGRVDDAGRGSGTAAQASHARNLVTSWLQNALKNAKQRCARPRRCRSRARGSTARRRDEERQVEHEGAARGIHVRAPRLKIDLKIGGGLVPSKSPQNMRIHDSKDRVVDWWPSGGVAASMWLPARPAATWLRSRPPARLLTRRWRGWPHMATSLLACSAVAWLACVTACTLAERRRGCRRRRRRLPLFSVRAILGESY